MFRSSLLSALAVAGAANAYWLMGAPPVTNERLDPIINPGGISAHAHGIYGSSAFRADVKTSEELRKGMCTSIPIAEDKSAYWFPKLYFQHKDGSFTDIGEGAVIYYLFGNDGKAQPFPENFRMISGSPNLRTYDPNSKAQQAITFLCLDFNGKSVTYNELPPVVCPSGIRAQVNFQMCWDGKNADSPDHQSHVAYPSEGADKGSCNDPNFPVTLPRIFAERYLDTAPFYKMASDALNPKQPFVLSNGDPTGYSYHGDFMMGWNPETLKRALAPDGCTCDIYGGLDCCFNKGIFTRSEGECKITPTFDEKISGRLPKLPGNNPVTTDPSANTFPIDTSPARFAEIIEYKGKTPPRTPALIPGSGGQPPAVPSVPAPGPSAPSSPPSVPSASASATVTPSAPILPSASVPGGNPAPSPSTPGGNPVPPVVPSASAPVEGVPGPSASAPIVLVPSLPTYPSASIPVGSDPSPSANVPENPSYPNYPKPSDIPPVPSPSGSGLPLAPSSTPNAPSQPMPTNPPYGHIPKPPSHHNTGHGNGTCKPKKKGHGRKASHRRRLSTSY